ncbi:MAG: 30S ribosomal protein S9 [Candidatus Hydrogenedentes bacterium]|nr:30S ribosomal protein S9 [Candidatus Hydrogenedentota bacterium]
MAEQVSEYIATGRRKTSVARVRVKPGVGQVLVNGKPVAEYFQRETLVMLVEQPLREIDAIDKYDIRVRVNGGGLSSQAGALRHGISRALIKIDDSFRSPLKKAGFLTRDPRMKERKKYGQRGARARFQFSKR